MYLPGASRRGYDTLASFRFIPRWPAGQLTVSETNRDRITLAIGTTTATVDPLTGAVERVVTRDARGETTSILVLKDFATYPGDIYLPAVAVEGSFQNGRQKDKLFVCRISVIEDALFNRDLPKDAFAVAVPAGTLVLDNLEPGKENGYTLPVAVADIAGYVRSRHPQPVSKSKESGSSWYWGTGGLLSLGCVGLWFLRKRRSV